LRKNNFASPRLNSLIHNFEDFVGLGWESLFSKEGPKTLKEIRNDYYKKSDIYDQVIDQKNKIKKRKSKKRKMSTYEDSELETLSEDLEDEEDVPDLSFGPNRDVDKLKKVTGKSLPKLSKNLAKERMKLIFDII